MHAQLVGLIVFLADRFSETRVGVHNASKEVLSTSGDSCQLRNVYQRLDAFLIFEFQRSLQYYRRSRSLVRGRWRSSQTRLSPQIAVTGGPKAEKTHDAPSITIW